MDGDPRGVAEVIAAVSRAVATALDPATILIRAVTALAPAVEVRAAEIWLGEGDEQRLLAEHRVGAADPDGTCAVSLVAADRALGSLLATPAPGAAFDGTERALLDLAAAQIAGALERVRLFQEVMELERLKSDFISRVSHELRTPITIISGFLDTLLAHDATLGPEQRRHMLERSQAASARMQGLIEELLILSRLDAGVLTPASGEVDVASVLSSVRAAAAAPAQVILEVPAGATVDTDGELLARALGLVVDNAIKYGGTAEVRAILPDGGLDRWTFEVRDRGAGFASDIRDTAFEMFTRSRATTNVPGLGVGLPIARTLVEVLDGSIVVDHDHAGAGALVRITIPAR